MSSGKRSDALMVVVVTCSFGHLDGIIYLLT